MVTFRRLESWLYKTHIKKSLIQWMHKITSMRVNVAQETNSIPITLGGLQRSEAGYLPTNGRLPDMPEDWNMVSIQ